jgi:hypothetical protein
VTAWDVELLPAPPQNLRTVSGTVFGPDGQPESGALVVLTDAANVELGTSTVAAEDGSYVLFSVRQGQYNLTALRQGTAYDVTSAQVGSQDVQIDIRATGGPLTTVTGQVNLVATNQQSTQVVLIVPSVGQVPPGLIVDLSGGSFSIPGVAPGLYDIIPSYLNDTLVLDPSSIAQAGAAPRIEVTEGEVDAGIFKVTAAVELDGAEGDQGANPTFSWAAYPSAQQYAVELRDATGSVIWGGIQSDAGEIGPLAGPSLVMGSTSVTYPGDPALTTGRVYQYRVYAFKVAATTACRCELISVSEDLRGIFRVAPAGR